MKLLESISRIETKALKRSLVRVALGAALLAPAAALAAATPQIPLAAKAKAIPMFVDQMPLLQTQPGGTIQTVVAPVTSLAAPLQITMCEFQSNILPTGAITPGVKTPTTVWGYVVGSTCPTTVQDTYLGPVLVNVRGTPTAIKFTNALPRVSTTGLLAYKFSTDQTLEWADPLGAQLNACKDQIPEPPALNAGIAAFKSPCSLNYGENGPGVFNPAGIPAVPHLHGGEVPPVLDGGPNAWFMSDGSVKGNGYYSAAGAAANEAIYRYPNTQGAAPIWFHDHVLGATRLNVYAGIAGAYYIVDPAEAAHQTSIGMRGVGEVIPLVLQDRQFDTTGQLYFPAGFPGGLNGPPPNPQHPYWNPEFIGDTIVVNGKAWPFVNVEPRRYRFLFLNGSNARTYEMSLANLKSGKAGPPLWVIGNDGGFLDVPAAVGAGMKKPALVIMPGERYEVIIDFTGLAGQTLTLVNTGRTPYPGGPAPDPKTTGQLVQFKVAACPVAGCPADASYNPASGIPLRPNALVRIASNGTIAPTVPVAKVRQLTLNEVLLGAQKAIDPVTGVFTKYPGGPFEILVNNTSFMGNVGAKTRPDFSPFAFGGISTFVSETPAEGTTELWEIVNLTADAHPIHTHLATFQILNRQQLDVKKYGLVYDAAFGTNPSFALPAGCLAGVYCPGYGPPLDYNIPVATRTVNGAPLGVIGGNPDVTASLMGPALAPLADESGWKDTVVVMPGMVTRFLIRFAPTETPANVVAGYPFSPNDATTGYVWHCHIIDHEDNEMMRPSVITPLNGATRTILKGVDY